MNPVCGPTLGGDGVRVANELLAVVAEEGWDSERARRLYDELEAAQRRVEDEHAARLGLPPTP